MTSRNDVIIFVLSWYLFLGIMGGVVLQDLGVERTEEIETTTFIQVMDFLNTITLGFVDALVNGIISFLEWFGATIEFSLDLSGSFESLYLGYAVLPYWLNSLIFGIPATILTWNLVTGIYPSGGN